MYARMNLEWNYLPFSPISLKNPLFNEFYKCSVMKYIFTQFISILPFLMKFNFSFLSFFLALYFFLTNKIQIRLTNQHESNKLQLIKSSCPEIFINTQSRVSINSLIAS